MSTIVITDPDLLRQLTGATGVIHLRDSSSRWF